MGSFKGQYTWHFVVFNEASKPFVAFFGGSKSIVKSFHVGLIIRTTIEWIGVIVSSPIEVGRVIEGVVAEVGVPVFLEMSVQVALVAGGVGAVETSEHPPLIVDHRVAFQKGLSGKVFGTHSTRVALSDVVLSHVFFKRRLVGKGGVAAFEHFLAVFMHGRQMALEVVFAVCAVLAVGAVVKVLETFSTFRHSGVSKISKRITSCESLRKIKWSQYEFN